MADAFAFLAVFRIFPHQNIQSFRGIACHHNGAGKANIAKVSRISAHVNLVVGRITAIDFLTHATETEIGHMVKAASVLAPRNHQRNLGLGLVVECQTCKLVPEVLGIGDADTAGGGPGTGNDIRHITRPFLDTKTERPYCFFHRFGGVSGQAHKNEILVPGDPEFFRAVLFGNIRQGFHLFRSKEAQGRIDNHRRAAVMLAHHTARRDGLRGLVRIAPVQGRPGPLGQDAHPFELFLEQGAEFLFTEPLDKEFDARGIAVDAVGISLMKADQGFEHSRHILFHDKIQEAYRGNGYASGPPATINDEPLLSVLFGGDKPQVMNPGSPAIGLASGNGNFELSRHMLN